MIWEVPRSKGGIVIRKAVYFLLCILLLLTILVGCAKSNNTPVPPTPTPFIGSARVELGDITMYFVAQGEGKPLILLHGGGSCSDAWFNQVPVFMKQYYVITPDNRGQGRTTDSDAPLSYHLMAEDTIRLMDYLGIDSAYIVGWSDGAVIAIDLAIHHPERVKALVAYGANINPEGMQDSFIEWVRNVTVSEMKQTLGIGCSNLSPDPEHVPIIIEKIRAMWLTLPNFTAEELASIKVPTLIIDGQTEELVRTNHAQEIADAIPHAELVILPNVGHFAVVDKPEEWNNAVLDFLNDK
jgi:pimeloyl-ACP methyl ester carboxylesterase